MGYIQELEKELRGRLVDMLNEVGAGNDEDYEVLEKGFIRFIKERILESYNNGILIGKGRNTVREAEGKMRQFSKGRK